MCITNRWTPAGRTAYAANMKACLQEESVIQVSCKSLMWCLYSTTRDAAEHLDFERGKNMTSSKFTNNPECQ